MRFARSGGFRLRVIALSIALALLPWTALSSQAAAPPGCARGSLDAALSQLFPAATLVREDELGALALLPVIEPGIRVRLVPGDGVWCDAQRAFNVVASGTPIEVATAYAKVAAAPWFDGVSVTDARETLPGVVVLTTHARTNGVVADWTVVTDARGIVGASFTAVAFAVAPFDPVIEGYTALPGFSRSFARDEAGLLLSAQPLVPATDVPRVQRVAIDRMSDGFEIVFRYGPGALPFYPTVDELGPTGVIRAVAAENYEEFLSWGLTKGWSRNQGDIYVDDDIALQCLACVFIGLDFNIHVFSGVTQALAQLGYSYPDERAAMATVIGHEMFHNFQNRYSRPVGGVNMGGSFSEGMARFQETLHAYSGVSHQPDSLVYARDANGCNDELGVQGGQPNLASGPATAQSYSACDFWLTFYGQQGIAGIRAALAASPAHRPKAGWDELRAIVQDAAGAPVEDTLARFAASLLTGAGLTWGPAAGVGASHDWNTYLLGWPAGTLAPGGSLTQTLVDGGMMGARVTIDGTLSVNTTAVKLYVIDDAGTPTPIVSGASVDAPAWVVAIDPAVGSANVKLSYA